uniref:Cytochrome P450 CYP4236B1 n=1 Tax=Chrysoperla zastrowi sillemi TaxID=482137 RepID=A0A9E7YEF6_9NEOP|nr:cytochrome P450 CYP4236B1 [Chrysoperla zastrowi sillemi]
MQRQAISPIFTPKMMTEYMPSFSNHCELLKRKLQSIPNGKLIDVYAEIAPFTYDIVCETLLGTKVRFAQNTWKSEFFHLAELGYEIVFERMIKSLYQSDVLFYFSKRYNDYVKIQKLVDNFTRTILKDKQSDTQKPFDTCLDRILKHDLTEKQQMDATYVIFTASQESITTIISFVILMLAIHPDIQQKAHEELDRVLGTEDDEIPFTIELLNSLEYLDMCIKEVLRLYPIGHIIQRECKQDFRLNNDVVLPSGCSIGVGIYAMHRDPNIWPEPDKFIPERFTREAVLNRHPYAYVPFSAGPMNCIGKIYADLLMKSVAATILRNNRFECDYKRVEEITLKTDISIRPQKGYPVRIYSR